VFIGQLEDIDGVVNVRLIVPEGATVELTLVNVVDTEHDWMIAELGVATERGMTRGDTAVVIFTADQIGEFEYFCSVPGHASAGMVGTFTVVHAVDAPHDLRRYGGPSGQRGGGGMSGNLTHPWLRGPVDGVPAGLQPVAHALVQSKEDVREIMDGFPDELLWSRVAGLAPVGFHLRHIRGVIDRLFTTAARGVVTEEQRQHLEVERRVTDEGVTVVGLVAAFDEQVGRSLDHLRNTDPETLFDAREVGSKRLPSTVAGLLFHAAEHAQRHCGQLLVTTRVLQERR
jgi:hypothetical protein